MKTIRIGIYGWILVFGLAAEQAAAQEPGIEDQMVFGIKLRAGGRFDNVRMCVATDPGVKGGPAMDISFFAEFGVGSDTSISVDLPVMRPILFGLAFEMLQFEPEVTLNFRKHTDGDTDIIIGPTLGFSLHYGPDYESDRSGDARGPSFFALGPRIGGYFALDFTRPQKSFNFQLGLSPYVTPLFSINDTQEHRGIVIGGTLDGLFRFTADK